MSKREKGDAPEMEGMLKKLKRAGDCFRGTPDGKDMASTEPASAVETPPEAGRPDETTPESAPPLGRRGRSPEGRTSRYIRPGGCLSGRTESIVEQVRALLS
jgi:hypothetical protein